MLVEYWFSAPQGRWLVADKATGELIAQFTSANDITSHFMQEIVDHATEQCDCSDCETERDEIATESLIDVREAGYYTEGGYGDSFS